MNREDVRDLLRGLALGFAIVAALVLGALLWEIVPLP